MINETAEKPFDIFGRGLESDYNAERQGFSERTSVSCCHMADYDPSPFTA